MRNPMKKEFIDLSTTDSFRFIFRCERCGAGTESERYVFNTGGFTRPLDERSRSLLWLRQHAAAYERARDDAMYDLNLCPVCGQRVCVDCFRLIEKSASGICSDCGEKINNRTPHKCFSKYKKEGR